MRTTILKFIEKTPVAQVVEVEEIPEEEDEEEDID